MKINFPGARRFKFHLLSKFFNLLDNIPAEYGTFSTILTSDVSEKLLLGKALKIRSLTYADTF